MKRRGSKNEDMVWVPSLYTVIIVRRRGQSFSWLRDMNCDLQDGLSLVRSWSHSCTGHCFAHSKKASCRVMLILWLRS
ncbi:hypothetical protein GIB67_038883 [Kingdonia uniflora]|uniref:Uncharacterized protein n=1 Tax=Kingdonia uniflora TaxID=39325 RepID=A0A7J7M2N2_9MAGN|nr:hypothetical protein GIB67_038883 [Kingdonia uniflora]